MKAVDPAKYPFYGNVDLSPAGSLRSVLTPDSVIVADDLLVRLHLRIGDQLKIGTKYFRIAATVVNEPDRLSGNFATGPRVLITREGLEASGLLAPGSHAGQALSLQGPQAAQRRTDLRRSRQRHEAAAGEAAARVAGDRLSRDQSRADAGPRPRHQSALADVARSAGAGCSGRGDGDARTPAAAAGLPSRS